MIEKQKTYIKKTIGLMIMTQKTKKVSDDTVETINLIDGVPFVDLKRKQNSSSKKTYQKI